MKRTPTGMWFGGLWSVGPRHPSVLWQAPRVTGGDRYRPISSLAALGPLGRAIARQGALAADEVDPWSDASGR